MLLAQAATEGGSSILAFLPFVLIIAAFYFFLIRPQRQKMRRQQQVADSVEVGDQVQTFSGVFGVVVSIDEEAVVLGLDDGRMRVARRAIAKRLVDDEDE